MRLPMRLPIVSVLCVVLGGVLAAGSAQADTARVNTFYGEAKGGLVIPLDSDVDNSSDDLSYELGYMVAGALGYQFRNGFRFEVEGSYREYEADEFEGQNANGEAEIGTVLGNLYYDINFGGRLTPYIGLGMGVSFIDLDGIESGGSFFEVDDGTQFAFALHGGLGVEVTDRLDLTVNYTFLGHEVDLFSNTLSLGLRAEF